MQPWPQLLLTRLVLLLLLLLLAHASAPAAAATAAAAAPPASSSTSSSTPAAAASIAGTPAETAAAGPPEFCRPAGSPGAAYPGAAAPTSMVWGGNMLKVYRNLYLHNKKWYAVLDPSSDAGSIDAGMAHNSQLIMLPTTDAEELQANMQLCYVPGVTLFIDFPFPAFPDNLGHWAEVLLPLYSALNSPRLPQLLQGGHRHIDRVVLVNVQPQLMYSWPKEVLGLALEPALPPWPEPGAAGGGGGSSGGSSGSGGGWHTSLPWDRPLPPVHGAAAFEGWCAHSWVEFENVVIAQDRYDIVTLPNRALPQPPAAAGAAGAERRTEAEALAGLWANTWGVGFLTEQLAAKFRAAALARHRWYHPPPAARQPSAAQQQQQQQQQCAEGEAQSCAAGASSDGGGGGGWSIPRTVTVLLYPEDFPPVTNHHQLVRMLEDLTEPYGFKVRPVSLTMGAPFLSHMATMADTGILVGRHGPLLASSVLLPPGAAVLELLPYKWEWRGVSTLYRNMTQSTGALHHWAWRPLDARWCKYKEPSHARYAGWLPQECQARDCLLVHAQAGLEVDLEAVRQLLARKLPGLLAGHSVERLREPWPAAE